MVERQPLSYDNFTFFPAFIPLYLWQPFTLSYLYLYRFKHICLSLVLQVTARRRSVTKHKWSEVEVQAVEKHMDKFISSGKTPGKKACTACIMAEQDALKARNWKNIKFYIKNRITSLRRQSSKPLHQI